MKNSYSLPYDLTELRARIQKSETFTYRLFYADMPCQDRRLSDAVFSQFYKSRFNIDGQRYDWAEQWMMAGKARLFKDEACLQKILNARSPEECKQYGREVLNYNEEQWNAVRFNLVTQGNVAKFDQSIDLRTYLLATDDDIIVHAVLEDKIWGIGLDRNDPFASEPLLWRGLNLLGFALVKARDILRAENYGGISNA